MVRSWCVHGAFMVRSWCGGRFLLQIDIGPPARHARRFYWATGIIGTAGRGSCTVRSDRARLMVHWCVCGACCCVFLCVVMFCGVFMVRSWYIHGAFMVRSWCVRGAFMVRSWCVHCAVAAFCLNLTLTRQPGMRAVSTGRPKS